MKLPKLTAVLACAFMISEPAMADSPDVLPLQEVPGVGLALDVTVDGHLGRFLFDTGWGVSAVTPTVAAIIGCKPWGRVTGFRAIGERLDSQRCNAATFRAGGFQAKAPEVIVVDLMKFLPPGTQPLSGGIGLDLFAGHTVTIQSHLHRLVLETSASREARIKTAQGITVRPVRDAQGAALTVDVAVPTADGPAWMELDTGNNGPTLIAAHVADLVGVKAGEDKPQPLTMPLRPGVTVRDAAIVRDLILDGDIGRGFLDHWDLTLDLAQGKGWLAPAQQ
ncbi:aspartyl protease family protein [Nguyenibacter vanlangensis]|uniref:Aspartyl protease family protein n=1 Tax=Nguyenibacter vanlangensis TaxID=1216886 RepID=A0ABZ3D3M1_9PROT